LCGTWLCLVGARRFTTWLWALTLPLLRLAVGRLPATLIVTLRK
jgi:hypothetical protein